jgi:hypothetical protein
MQKYQSTTPDWLYHTPELDLNKLPVIQKELLKLFLLTKKDNLVPYTSTFTETADGELIIKTCPTLVEELKRLKLFEITKFVAFISVDSQREFPPHVDVGVDIALNIPLLNCEGTYTVWYDGEITQKGLPDYAIGTEIAKISRLGNPRNLTEIGRCDANKPHWINVNVLHRPETHHDRFRVAASIRFIPDPINTDGSLWPHLIRE